MCVMCANGPVSFMDVFIFFLFDGKKYQRNMYLELCFAHFHFGIKINIKKIYTKYMPNFTEPDKPYDHV